jgi:hypothetical protein
VWYCFAIVLSARVTPSGERSHSGFRVAPPNPTPRCGSEAIGAPDTAPILTLHIMSELMGLEAATCENAVRPAQGYAKVRLITRNCLGLHESCWRRQHRDQANRTEISRLLETNSRQRQRAAVVQPRPTVRSVSEAAESTDEAVHDGAGFPSRLIPVSRQCHIEGRFTHRAQQR